MTKLFRVIAIVALTIAAFGGTVAAYDGAKKEIVVIQNGEESTFETRTRTVEEFLEENNITIYEADEINKSMLYYLNDGDTIVINKAPEVILNINGVPKLVRSMAQTVGELLDDMKDTVGEGYVLEGVSEDDKIETDMVINVSVPTEAIRTKSIETEYETEYVLDASLAAGQQQVVQQGVNGKSIITLKETYLNNELVSTEQIDEEIIQEPVNAIIKKGISYGETVDVSTLSYSKKLTVTATGYTPYDPGCNGVTATGTAAKRGVIAVDPSVIPLGTKVYIPGYGIGIAEDTGGAIKGNKIDLCYSTKSEAYSWGRRTVDIYILD